MSKLDWFFIGLLIIFIVGIAWAGLIAPLVEKDACIRAGYAAKIEFVDSWCVRVNGETLEAIRFEQVKK